MLNPRFRLGRDGVGDWSSRGQALDVFLYRMPRFTVHFLWKERSRGAPRDEQPYTNQADRCIRIFGNWHYTLRDRHWVRLLPAYDVYKAARCTPF
jgi:hypothetical protein